MQLRKRQIGGIWGLAFTLGTLGFVVFIALKVQPVYMNEWKIKAAVKSVAGQGGAPEMAKRDLQRRWDVDDMNTLKVSEIKVVNKANGKVLAYDYWNQVELFKGVYLSFNFVEEFPLGGGVKY